MTKLRLYVAGHAPNSMLAKRNLNAVLATCAAGTYDLEVIDCLSDPERTLTDGIVVTPTLLKLEPEPRSTIIGTLADQEHLRRVIGLDHE